ncbi:hypothetical protein LshimejAT787_1303530 [Lyophyllum shimeji]|uniref:Uncharacterized protein n=1 Tax=Lyophyllum shimeji TaxID=47721 RepID=A0A9P3USR0_LYOSH|nr:hypothetical protein LshimejAT787_1303530 [Lyophyllum shimeji]
MQPTRTLTLDYFYCTYNCMRFENGLNKGGSGERSRRKTTPPRAVANRDNDKHCLRASDTIVAKVKSPSGAFAKRSPQMNAVNKYRQPRSSRAECAAKQGWITA